MKRFFCFMLILLCAIQDSVSRAETKTPFETMKVALGDPLVLDCTFNCSSGFICGWWSTGSGKPGCEDSTQTTGQSDFCTVTLSLPSLSVVDLKHNYTCFTEDRQDPQLPQKRERVVSLKPQEKRNRAGDIEWMVSPKTEAGAASREPTPSLSPPPEDAEDGGFVGMKWLLAVTVMVASVLAGLAVYLCMIRGKQTCVVKGEAVASSSDSPSTETCAILSPVRAGTSVTSCDRVTLRIPTPDNQSDTEVSYADIMITVRGASTPELTQVCCLTPGNPERWRAGLGPPAFHLHASRSADRLHLSPREVSRKMSTNSEYAVITYS